MPNLAIQLVKMTVATVFAEMSGSGIASGHLENLSTIVRQYRHPLEIGIGPMISTCMCSKRPEGTLKCPIGALLCLVIFAFWH